MWGGLSSGAVIWLWQVGSEEEMLMLGIWRRLYSPSGVGPVAALAERDVSAAGVVPLDHLLRVFHHSAWIMNYYPSHSPTVGLKGVGMELV